MFSDASESFTFYEKAFNSAERLTSYTIKFVCFFYMLYIKGFLVWVLEKVGGGARGVMVIVVGNGHGDTSSKPGRGWLHFT